MLQVELPTPLRITYATESSCVERWLAARRHEPAFGFDTETRPAYRKGEVFAPATLQPATAWWCTSRPSRRPSPPRSSRYSRAPTRSCVA